jgi:hypothetical protein
VIKAVHGAATPEEVPQVLSDHLRGGEFFAVHAETGKPIVDLRALKAAGKLHLVKKVTDVGVELHSSQEVYYPVGNCHGVADTGAVGVGYTSG